MEKRVLGIILSLLGVAGLIYAGISFMNGGTGNRNIKAIIFSGIIGAIFFFAGISLVRNTKDKATYPFAPGSTYSSCTDRLLHTVHS